jgi:hypothetical protein
VALFNQRITMALTIISDAAEANKVIAAVKDRGVRGDRGDRWGEVDGSGVEYSLIIV